MSQIQSNSLTKTTPKTTNLHPQASNFIPAAEDMMYKSSIITSISPEKMAANTPVEIGSRGTVGSLILKEIEYFNKLDLGHRESPQKPRCQSTEVASTSHSGPQKRSSNSNPKKKKKRSSSSSNFLPSMCSMVEVAESNQPSGFSYRNLKYDLKKSENSTMLSDGFKKPSFLI